MTFLHFGRLIWTAQLCGLVIWERCKIGACSKNWGIIPTSGSFEWEKCCAFLVEKNCNELAKSSSYSDGRGKDGSSSSVWNCLIGWISIECWLLGKLPSIPLYLSKLNNQKLYMGSKSWIHSCRWAWRCMFGVMASLPHSCSNWQQKCTKTISAFCRSSTEIRVEHMRWQAMTKDSQQW